MVVFPWTRGKIEEGCNEGCCLHKGYLFSVREIRLALVRLGSVKFLQVKLRFFFSCGFG